MATRIVFLSLEHDNTNQNNFELGLSDGSVGGATIDDLFPGVDGSNFFNSSRPDFFAQLGDKVLFFATNAANGRELWITDGTAGNTQLLKDINAVAPTNTHSAFLELGNFNSQDHYDALKPLVINGTMYFTASDGTHGFELWKTDGTAVNTVLVKDINPSASNFQLLTYLTDLNGTLYFVGDDGTNHQQLWKSDGTDVNTVPVTTFALGVGADPNNFGPIRLVVSNNLLYFNFRDGLTSNQQLYVTDGVSSPHLLDPAEPAIGDPRNFADIDGTLYFTQDDGTHGYELWRSDGTPGGTFMVKDINTQGSLGLNAGESVPSNFYKFNGEVYFAADDGIHGIELWKTNGTSGGTSMVTDINLESISPGTTASAISTNFAFTEFNNELYFAATDGAAAGHHGIELWKTNGTAVGTILVADTWLGEPSGAPTQPKVIDGVLYFGANSIAGSGSAQLYRYDGVNPAAVISGNYHYGGAFQPFSFIAAAPNTPPTQNHNTGTTVNEGASTTVLNAQLDFDDTQQTDAQITYTVTSLPTNGTLFRNNVALAVSGTFTQDDIANNLLKYTHNGGETAADQFGFSVSDGIAAAVTGQTFAITVTPQNDPPVINSNGGGATANIDVAENSKAVTTVTVTDPDGPAPVFSIIGGSDAGKFEINASSGVLKFINAPDFEVKADSDANNSYVVQVRASDGALNDDQTITVNVTNVTQELAKPFDFNGDGKGDILWQNLDGTPAVWLLDGVNVISTGPALPNPNAGQSGIFGQPGQAAPWHEVSAGDFNGDGKADILWQKVDGTAAVWLMDGTSLMAMGGPLTNPGPSWKVKEAADFNGDGKSDILWQNDNGTAGVWLMNGTSVQQTGGALPNPGASWHTKAAADFNADGKADILWQNDNGQTGVWLMDGVNVLAAGGALPNADASWHAVAANDFNGDGKADILWQNDSGAARVWLMDGTTVLTQGPTLANPGPAWHVKEAIDTNADGKADILWQNDDGTPGVWLMNGTSVLQTGGALQNSGAAWHII